MLKLGVIKPVSDATPWISNFVIIESNKDTAKLNTNDAQPKSKLHVCFDPSNLNKATTESHTTTIPSKMSSQSSAMPGTLLKQGQRTWIENWIR